MCERAQDARQLRRLRTPAAHSEQRGTGDSGAVVSTASRTWGERRNGTQIARLVFVVCCPELRILRRILLGLRRSGCVLFS